MTSALSNEIRFWIHTAKIVAEYQNSVGIIHVDDSYFGFTPIREGGSIPVYISENSNPEALFTLGSLTDHDLELVITSFEDKNKGDIIATRTGMRSPTVVSLPINQEAPNGALQRFSLGFEFEVENHIYTCSLDPKLRATQPPSN